MCNYVETTQSLGIMSNSQCNQLTAGTKTTQGVIKHIYSAGDDFIVFLSESDA